MNDMPVSFMAFFICGSEISLFHCCGEKKSVLPVGGIPCGAKAVSYTHLDVYKRQEQKIVFLITNIKIRRIHNARDTIQR